MCPCKAGGRPAVSYRALLSRCAAVAAIFALPGCANQTAHYSDADARVVQTAAADIEDDGLPAQTPPSARIRSEPDDPNEPFSRNYGGINPSHEQLTGTSEQLPFKLPDPVIPKDLPA